MNNLYNDQYLKITLNILKDNIADLSAWSVYNDDKYNEEINDIKKAFECLTQLSNKKSDYELPFLKETLDQLNKLTIRKCQHETIDAGDAEHTVIVCTKCQKILNMEDMDINLTGEPF